jgi:polyhydroxyalkanoate synthase
MRLLEVLGRVRASIGTTPSDVVLIEHHMRLVRYRGRGGPPIVLVPSLINRHYVLDLLPGRSLVAFLLEAGFDVFTIDWGTPGGEARYEELDSYCDRYIARAVRRAARIARTESVHVLGYCLGGTLAAIFAALHPERVRSLVLLAAPIRFAGSGLLSAWTNTKAFDAGAVARAFGNIPWPLMQASFHLLRPTLALEKAIQLVDKAEDDSFLEGFLAVEAWSNDNVSFPGRAYERYIEELYRRDLLVSGELVVSGRRIDLSAIRCPSLVVTFEHDHIVPADNAAAILGRTSGREERIHLSGGHVGAVVSRRAGSTLFGPVTRWLAGVDAASQGRGSGRTTAIALVPSSE